MPLLLFIKRIRIVEVLTTLADAMARSVPKSLFSDTDTLAWVDVGLVPEGIVMSTSNMPKAPVELLLDGTVPETLAAKLIIFLLTVPFAPILVFPATSNAALVLGVEVRIPTL